MQTLDNFISPIPSFDGDIQIPTMSLLARPPCGESISDPSTGACASVSKTKAGKRKAATNLTL